MRKLGLLIGAIAAAFALAGAPVAAASPAPQAAPIPCSTWQYNTDAGKPIYSGSTGTGLVGYTANGGFVNVTGFNENFRGGNFYNSGGGWYNVGWIHISHIHYVRCW
ncbi:hypothetical protein ALI22I_03510 [Saccharothrix sp. ALI-22-I]|uniref:hypothetical protein n=1 Tax=Saccharothrix sp. ALI-22-I TaxID=1933778 RepID=UPI00097C20C5|nr:hypothetical protein [Saccharothrix sp. ALI-22-I]ONI92481.1 hypothetical protein ALI22I_03510 [Saccharothrix sp. ALI-22-I]